MTSDQPEQKQTTYKKPDNTRKAYSKHTNTRDGGQRKAGPKPAQKVEDVFEYAIWWLNQRGYSVAKLKEKLTRKTTNAEWVKEVINRLLELGYLNDQRYAETYVNSRCRSYGPSVLAQKLKLQGVAQADIDNALLSIDESEQDVLITRVINKYAGKKSARDISLRLQQQGVSASRIQAILPQSLDSEHEQQLAERLIAKHEKKMGTTGLIQKLRSEGISQECIDQVLLIETEQDGVSDDQRKALEFLNKKYKSPITDFADKKKATAFLVRKGFSFTDANYALEHHLE